MLNMIRMSFKTFEVTDIVHKKITNVINYLMIGRIKNIYNVLRYLLK